MNPKLLVQSLSSGLRGQILLAFLFAGRSMDVYELAEWTGRPRNAHGPHLRALCGTGMLARSSKRMAHGRDVFHLGSEVLPFMQDLAAKLSAGKYIEEADADAQVSDILTPGATLVLEAVARSPEDLESLNLALTDCGILGKKRNELLARSWVNAEYVRAMVEYEKGERQPEYAVGRAINKMLAHFAQPQRRTNGHIENCQCGKCKVDDALGRSKYVCPDCSQYPCACDDDPVEEGMVDDEHEVS